MKPINIVHSLLLAASLVACEPEEQDPPAQPSCTTGTLYCTNESLHTVQKILVRSSSATNWTNYGTIDPGETMNIALAAGSWDLKFQGINGGPGCNESSFNIAACRTVGRSCSY